MVWRLKVYPVSLYEAGVCVCVVMLMCAAQNGHKEEKGNYLAVFVELTEGYSTVAR